MFPQDALQDVGKLERCGWSSLPGNGSMCPACPVGMLDPVVVHRCRVQSRCTDLENKHSFMRQVPGSVSTIALLKLKRETPEPTRVFELTCFAALKMMFWIDGIPEALRVALAEGWKKCFGLASVLTCFQFPRHKTCTTFSGSHSDVSLLANVCLFSLLGSSFLHWLKNVGHYIIIWV